MKLNLVENNFTLSIGEMKLKPRHLLAIVAIIVIGSVILKLAARPASEHDGFRLQVIWGQDDAERDSWPPMPGTRPGGPFR